MTITIDAMRHYLTYEEFYEYVLRERVGDPEFSLMCEHENGGDDVIRFRDDWFQCRIILYTIPCTLDVGIIQEDSQDGWENTMREVWEDITEMCGWKPYIDVELKKNNLF